MNPSLDSYIGDGRGPTKRVVYLFELLAIATGIVFLITILRESKKMRSFFFVAGINLSISLVVFYNTKGKEDMGDFVTLHLLLCETCTCFFMIASIAFSVMGDRESTFNMLSYISSALAIVSLAIGYIILIERNPGMKAMCEAIFGFCYIAAALLLFYAGYVKAKMDNGANKILLLQISAVAAFQAFTNVVFFFFDETAADDTEILFKSYSFFITNALLPASAWIFFKQFEKPDENQVSQDPNYQNPNAILAGSSD